MRISGGNLIDLVDSKYTMVVMIVIEVILTCLILVTGLGWIALIPMIDGLIATGIFVGVGLFDYRNPWEMFKGEQLFAFKVIRFWISLLVIAILIVMLVAD